MKLLRVIIFELFLRPLILIGIGLNVRHRERIPLRGPAVIVANHNSHLDTLVLMSLFPRSILNNVRPVAAMDYFLRNKFMAWFSLRIMNVIPISRKKSPFSRSDHNQDTSRDPLSQLSQALESGEILIVFPEGTRGNPEELAEFKSGVAHLSKRHIEIPIIPVFIHGLGKILPKGEWLPVPFFCDVFVGEGMYWTGDRESFMLDLQLRMNDLKSEGSFSIWD